MGISSFFGIETSLRGLLAAQAALDTTSHNISNANTPGYSRQQVSLAPTDSLRVAGMGAQSGTALLGTGVQATDVTRIRNTFLDAQYRGQAMQVGYQSTMSDQLTQVQASLDEPGTNGISNQLSKYWDAWGAVSNDPSSAAARQTLVAQGTSLAGAFKTVADQLSTIKTQAAGQYSALTGAGGTVAQLAGQIASLNQTIKSAKQAGDTPNDLLDQRDLALDQLSKLGQVPVQDLGNGSLKVSLGDASQPIVNDTTVTWPQTLTSPGGQLGALLDLSKTGGVVDGYTAQLNAAAKSLADSVNAIHSTGTPAGVNFFSYTAGSEATTLQVAVTPAQVVTSTTGAPDANDLAISISQLRGGTADTNYSSFVTQIGSDTKNAGLLQSNAQALSDSIDSQRQSTSGVSMDQEMSDLIRFQRGYQAAARAMTTMDGMLDQLINRTGKVGL